ncbi:hypothetical protein PAXRUDRAFT_37046 [Paxillus rubicundulus Ve08.2h10]|uniref:Uncharacterized protein n=1 Tax=Paxillus rubicundulus Ve08.2h10 TaxID=930991 RepID=A0A0D0D2T0_9AGAM|nr:hypothetical protein PAXRUDRAFT_37046 [Paxillus rubicundulus Ve08.2h10]
MNSIYRTLNLMLTSILPGLKKQTPDQIQRFISCLEGHLVCVILVAIVCDKPAAHKMGGFGSHSHTNLCMCCWITQADKDKARAFMKDAFNFVKQYAMQYTELSRLLYFNLVEKIVIDPMHNLFLGEIVLIFTFPLTAKA